ncbi:unnamed protein product, partial [marine sediment metagenome]
SLRERTEDVPLLVDYILRKLRSKKTVSIEANEKLQNYNWPGNIRELENAIERAVIIAKDTIYPEHILLPETKKLKVSSSSAKTLRAAANCGREVAEAEIIKKILEQTDGNKSKAARRLKVSYKTLLNRIKKYKEKGLL